MPTTHEVSPSPSSSSSPPLVGGAQEEKRKKEKEADEEEEELGGDGTARCCAREEDEEEEEEVRTRLGAFKERVKSFIERIRKKRRKMQKARGLFAGSPKYRATSRDRLISSFLARLRQFTGLSFFVGVLLLLSFDHFNRELTVEEHGFSHGVHHASFLDDSLFYRLRNLLQDPPGASLPLSAEDTQDQKTHDEDEEDQTAADGRESDVDASQEEEEEDEEEEESRKNLSVVDPSDLFQASSYPFLFLPRTRLFFPPCEEDKPPLRLSRSSSASSSLSSSSSFHFSPPPRFFCALASFLKSHGVHEVYIQPFFIADDREEENKREEEREEREGEWHYNLIAVSKTSRGDSRDALAFFFSFDYSSLSPSSSSSSSSSVSSSSRRAVAEEEEEGRAGGAGSLASVMGVLAIFLQNEAPWLSKDVFFVLSDSRLPYKAGTRAWVSAYLRSPSFFPRRGLLRMAVGLEAAGGSASSSSSFSEQGAEREEGFSFLSVDIEGADGRLPNQDLVNVVLAEANRGGIAVKLRNVSPLSLPLSASVYLPLSFTCLSCLSPCVSLSSAF